MHLLVSSSVKVENPSPSGEEKDGNMAEGHEPKKIDKIL